jgi:hypothetical protein
MADRSVRRTGGDHARAYNRGVTAAHDYEDVHNLVDRLTPDQVSEVRAHMLRLAAGRRAFVPWVEAQAGAAKLPLVDYVQFRDDVDTWIDQDHFLGDRP